ncbi:hypothetical protein EIP91_003622 [Steccherinum ochraceum]|uniref:BTB domain-containing protein n=1 Tax=Steccherinum ochraceum TaxID=92696 RepID=A0A4R0RGI0_9APHY|nr:hypothetical protein EIP91_003622 [Steccherinum ochraceum]
MVGFGESVDPTAAIASILGTYPFGIGLFREILQNSDDAKATTQYFLLDHRSHGTDTLLHEALGDAQGPALLAYNNAQFLNEDWVALQRIHQSSKRTDTSKIGKYGIGFRSCYHITDTPQIMSGSFLAVLDPHHSFSEEGGLKVDITADAKKYADHFAAFNVEKLVPSYVAGTPLDGTIIRLPLRLEGSESRISTKTLTTEEIRQLLVEFVEQEMAVSLLFLSHLTSIKVLEVRNRKHRRLGRVKIERKTMDCPHPRTEHEEVRVALTLAQSETQFQIWRLVRVAFRIATCAAILSSRLGYDVRSALQKEKLSPVVALAIPVPLEERSDGRLFTFLPLPLPTGFPCHNLWNCSEKGLVQGTRDQLLAEWNKVLFDTFIPRAWASLLHLLAESVPDLTTDSFFNAWPPASQQVSGGDPYDWQDVGLDVLRVLAEKQSPVWPLAVSGDFAPLNDVLVGQEAQTNYLVALSKAGVDVTVPPERIVKMMVDAVENCRMLTPETAHAKLLEDAPRVLVLSHEHKLKILEYLSSTKDTKMLVGVFVVPTVNGDVTALELAHAANGLYHVLLKGQEIDLFRSFDDEAISLTQLPPSVRGLFASAAAKAVNLVPLGHEHVAKYLTKFEPRDDQLNWLLRFWAWLATWPEKDKLFPSIQHMPLLPDVEGHLHALSSTVFRLDGIGDEEQSVLSKLGVSFLHPSFPQSAVVYLEKKEILKSAESPEALLKHLRPHLPHGLSQEELRVLSGHITHTLIRRPTQLPDNLLARLRNLPVFPIMTSVVTPNSASQSSQSLQPSVSIEYATLPPNTVVHVVDVKSAQVLSKPMQKTILLPFTQNITFIARTFQDLDVTPLTFQAVGVQVPVQEATIIEILVDGIVTQPKQLQKEFLASLVVHRQAIPPQTLQSLGGKEFVPVGNGRKLATPGNVIDPTHSIAQLFESNDVRLPRINDSTSKAIIQYLRALKLLRITLTDDIIKDRLKTYSKSGTFKGQATHLLRTLNDSVYDCSDLSKEMALCWLPTSKGMRKPSDCRDGSTHCSRALFDLVLDVLDVPEFQLTSTSLRAALGWDNILPLDIIKRQMDAEIRRGDSNARLELLVLELGSRVGEIEGSDIEEEFRQLLSMREWIPVDNDGLATSGRALLCIDKVPPGFERVCRSLMMGEGAVRFLRLMGCSERPSNAAILQELHAYDAGDEALSAGRIKDVFKLIAALDFDNLTEDEHSDLLIPDTSSVLRPPHELYYDDLGVRAYELQLPTDRYKVHDDLRSTLVPFLGIQTLGSLNLSHVDVDDEDMQEDLSTRIFNVLRQYSVDQAFNEFLANAADAGAVQYSLLLDKQFGQTDRILSPSMAQFQACPSLVVYNDAEFTEEDFKGIRHIGLGGKRSRTDAIGRFGLGALSMFHFTELSMIVSGEYVMFLDPSRKYLPPNGRHLRSSIRIPLTKMWSLHSDHLSILCGIHGFETNTEYYHGTLFRLPLRSDAQANISTLSTDPMSGQVVGDLINAYGTVAPQSLLNITVASVKAYKREHDGPKAQLWSAKATRQDIECNEPTYTCQQIKIAFVDASKKRKTETWHLVSEQTALDTLPEEFSGLTDKHKLRGVAVTLAGLTSTGEDSHPSPPRCKLYSRLPLPTPTALPVHIDASFILADDRRSIRFDEGGHVGLESQYNCWLLSTKVPSLYTLLLETWPQKDNVHMWPGSADLPDDPISRMVIEKFYAHHFASSARKFCLSMSGKRLAPSQATFVNTESKGVNRILKYLAPPHFVKLSKRLRMKALDTGTGVKLLDPDALHDAIATDSLKFCNGYGNGKRFEVGDVIDLIDRLLRGPPDAIRHIPILPLADDTLGIMKTESSPAFFAPNHQKPWVLFPAKHFTHEALDCAALIKRADLNVQKFTTEGAVELARSILPMRPVAALSNYQQDWVAGFWRQRATLDLDLKILEHIPLAPTDHGGVYVSLAHCNDPKVLAYRPEEDGLAFLGPIVKSLGATMVQLTPDHPQEMQDQISNIPGLLLDFENILRFLEVHGVSWVQQYRQLVPPDAQDLFSRFCLDHIHSLCHTQVIPNSDRRARVRYQKVVDHEQVAVQLPIWSAWKDGSLILTSASDPMLKMLPADIPSSRVTTIGPFIRRDFAYSGFDTRLEHLGVAALSREDFIKSLRFPDALSNAEAVTQYQAMLDVLIRAGMVGDGTNLKVPNSNGALVPLTTVYSHLVPLFHTVFGENSEVFLHASIRDQVHALSHPGLQSDINFSTFSECAKAVHDRHSDDRDRAIAVYQYYSDDLWEHLRTEDIHWQELDGYRFIPRAAVRRTYSNADVVPDQYAVPLPLVVAPSEVLRPGLEAVAWTQRALPEVTPSERLLVANLKFGIPTGREVVEHLRRLVLIADDHPNDHGVLNDLRETYSWLQAHLHACTRHLLQCQDELLFLNVDNTDPTWRFSSARHILFNGHDEGDWECAREFLTPFKTLLLAVGAKEIKQPTRPKLELSPADEVLVRLRTALNKQRQEGRLTDVELVSDDDVAFPAHRAILAASAKHFETMFGPNWSEQTEPVEVDAISEVLGHALDYIYSGSIPELESQEVLLGLLELSDCWDLSELFKSVENQLIPTISLLTYEELQRIGERYHAATLIKACEQFQEDNAHAL